MTITQHHPRQRIVETAETRWQRWTTDMQIIVTDRRCLAEARRQVEAELDAVEAAASRFRPDSEINRVAGSCGQPVEVSALLAELLTAALSAARQTDGDVDPTIGAALMALDDRTSAINPAVPQVNSITVGANWTMVGVRGRSVTVPRGVVLDLGATAKAIAADRCAARVHRSTSCGVLVNLGGDIATAGTEPEGGWQVLVQDNEDQPAAMIALAPGTALATSSTLHRRWKRGQHQLHHILDPRTGWSADPVWRTVSVAADSCLVANTVSTAAIIRGWRAVNWIRAQGMPARLVDDAGMVHTLGGWPPEKIGSPR